MSQPAGQNGVMLTGKEEDDDDRVDDGKPVNVDVGHFQVDIPPRRPPHVTLLKVNLIAPHHVSDACQTHTSTTFQHDDSNETFLWPHSRAVNAVRSRCRQHR